MSQDCNDSVLKIDRRENTERVLRWSEDSLTFKAISGITKAAPSVITAAAHGLPEGWRFWVESVKGMVEINRPVHPTDGRAQKHYVAEGVTTNTLKVRNLNALDFRDYSSGGVLAYYAPVDLDGASAVLTIYDNLEELNVLATLTDTPGEGITIDNTEKTITLSFDAAAVAGYEFDSGVAELVVTMSGVPTKLARWTVVVPP